MRSGLITNMKHTLYILLIITALVFVSCASKSKETKTVQNPPAVQTEQPAAETSDKTFTHTLSTNHSFLSEEHVGQTFVIKGYLSQNGENFILTENPTSKSRVTFYLEIADASLITKATALVNTTVEITGVLTDAPSPWSKKLKVQKIN